MMNTSNQYASATRKAMKGAKPDRNTKAKTVRLKKKKRAHK